MLKGFFSTRNGRAIFWVAIVIIIGIFIWLTVPKNVTAPQPSANAPAPGSLEPSVNAGADANANANANANKPRVSAPKPAAKPIGFVEKKAPHFVSSSIPNNATVAAVPPFLTLTFDTVLAKSTQSFLTVKKNDITDATVAPSSINEKTLVVQLNTQVTNGDYYVHYVACFADVGCKDGKFGYRVKLP
jgi:methionine-rich copper-binding protein CopC